MNLFRKLFGWLMPTKERIDLYHPKQRAIYHYWNGVKVIDADPMVLFKRLMAVRPEMTVDMKLSMSQSKDAAKGYENFISKIRDIFDIKKPDNPIECNDTLSEVELMELLDRFAWYCDEVKKNTNHSATLPSNSADSTTSAAEPQPTTSSLDSGSIGTEHATSKPMPSL